MAISQLRRDRARHPHCVCGREAGSVHDIRVSLLNRDRVRNFILGYYRALAHGRGLCAGAPSSRLRTGLTPRWRPGDHPCRTARRYWSRGRRPASRRATRDRGLSLRFPFRQLVVLKSDLKQVFSNGGHRWVLRQGAQPDGIPAVIFAKYRWKFGNHFHGMRS